MSLFNCPPPHSPCAILLHNIFERRCFSKACWRFLKGDTLKLILGILEVHVGLVPQGQLEQPELPHFLASFQEYQCLQSYIHVHVCEYLELFGSFLRYGTRRILLWKFLWEKLLSGRFAPCTCMYPWQTDSSTVDKQWNIWGWVMVLLSLSRSIVTVLVTIIVVS